MSTATDPDVNSLLDSLTPFDIAVLEMTSPSEITGDGGVSPAGQILVTSKASYLWAAAIAYVVVTRPDMEDWEVFDRVLYALKERAGELREIYTSPPTDNNITGQAFIGLNILKSFLEVSQMPPGAVDTVTHLAAEAMRNLENAGLIEDPLSKRVRDVLLTVVLLLPVNYTSTTEKGGVVKTQIESLAASYAGEGRPDHADLKLKLKVDKAVKAFKDKFVPAIEELINSESNC